MNRYTVCVDFDGVLHDYHGKWKGASVIEGRPVDGALDWLRSIADDFEVVILTTRGNTIIGQNAVTRWLVANGIAEELAEQIVVTDEKPPALVYIDDRAYRFAGDNWPTAAHIHEAVPWNRQRKDGASFIGGSFSVPAHLEAAEFEKRVDVELADVRRRILAAHIARRAHV